MEGLFSPVSRWPKEERPREKLLRDGEHRLSNTELLAVLLGTGTRGASSLDLARGLLQRHGSLAGLCRACEGPDGRTPGVGDAKICRVRAAAELGRRIAEEKAVAPGELIGSPADVFRMFRPRMAALRREVFKMLCLDSRNRIIRTVEVEEGTVNYASPILREVFHRALENDASSIVCCHNHPSGDPAPSAEDTRFTEALVSAGKVLQVAVLDHIIIAKEGYYSFADEGLIRQE